MTEEDRQLLLKTLQALEKMYYRSEALELLAEKFVPAGIDWKALVDKLAADPLFQPFVREGFRQLFASFEQATPSGESRADDLLRLLDSLPVRGKPN